MQTEISADLTELTTQLQQAETDLGQLNSHQIQDRLRAVEVTKCFETLPSFCYVTFTFILQEVIDMLDEMQPRLIKVDGRAHLLSTDDPEVDSICATVAGLRTRHATLESQACRYKQKLEVHNIIYDPLRYWSSLIMTFDYDRTRFQPKLNPSKTSENIKAF